MSNKAYHAFSQYAKRIWGYASTTHALSAKASKTSHGVVQSKKENGTTLSPQNPARLHVDDRHSLATKAHRRFSTSYFSNLNPRLLENLRTDVAPGHVPVFNTI